jgi:hypothetical protein
MFNLTTFADWNPEITSAKVLESLQPEIVLLPRVNRDFDTEVSSAGQSVKINSAPATTGKTKGEADNYDFSTPAQETPTTVQLEYYYSAVSIGNIARFTSRPSLMEVYMAEVAKGLLQKIEVDLFEVGASLSEDVGAYTSFAGLDEIELAKTVLNKSNTPKSNRYLFLDPDTYSTLTSDEKLTNSASYGSSVAIQGGTSLGVKGFEVLDSSNVKTTAGVVSGAGYDCLAIHSNALVLVSRSLPVEDQGEIIATYNGLPIKYRMFRLNESTGAYVLMAEALAGMSVLRDTVGVKILSGNKVDA